MRAGEEDLAEEDDEEDGFNDEMDLVMVSVLPPTLAVYKPVLAANAVGPLSILMLGSSSGMLFFLCNMCYHRPPQPALFSGCERHCRGDSCLLIPSNTGVLCRMRILMMMRATWMMTMAGTERAYTDSAMHPE